MNKEIVDLIEQLTEQIGEMGAAAFKNLIIYTIVSGIVYSIVGLIILIFAGFTARTAHRAKQDYASLENKHTDAANDASVRLIIAATLTIILSMIGMTLVATNVIKILAPEGVVIQSLMGAI